jgi:hypothetical protein
MARALVASVVVFPAGEGVALVFGAAVAFGEAVAAALGAGVGDAFFLAAEAATGAQQASAARQAVIRLSLFFIIRLVQERLYLVRADRARLQRKSENPNLEIRNKVQISKA